MTSLRSIAILLLFTITACKHARVVQNNTPAEKNVCDQVIRFYSDKLKEMNGTEEIAASSEIVVNPSTNIISISTVYNGEKSDFEVVVESHECNLNNNLTTGLAVYNGYVQKDGKKTPTDFKIEAKDGTIAVSASSPEQNGKGAIFQITKWETE